MSERVKEQIKVLIDGKECYCEKGEYLYDVAKRNDIFIPVLCRSDAFEDHRACCRVCIVEVETRGKSKVVTSCVYPIEEECTVYTQSEKIKEERAVVMALLAHRAPDSDVIGGMAEGMGGTEGFARLTPLEAGKCILCGLCVQACDSLGTGAISTVLRGTEKRVDTPYSNPSKACIGCLSCANVCPTGEIVFEENEKTRTIWKREFELVYCEECGALMGTKEMLERAAAETGVETPKVCDACRKKAMADEMMHTYRFV